MKELMRLIGNSPLVGNTNHRPTDSDMSAQPVPTVTLVDRLPGGEESPVSPVKEIVTKALGLPSYLNKYWDVTDLYPSAEAPELALAHYNDYYDPGNRQHEPIRRVRGVVVDLKTGAVVADAYGYTQNLPCFEPLTEERGSDDPIGSIQLQTEITSYLNDFSSAPEEIPKVRVGTRSFEKASTSIFIGYEGALIRVFKWNGQVFFSTHRRINAIRSNWGGRTPFLTLYKQLGGPALESFFGDEPYSPYCYMFLIVHNDIRIASSTRDNRIVFIGMKKVWDTEKYAQPGQPYAWAGQFQPHLPTVGQEPDVFSPNNNRALIIQPLINVEIANKFLFPNTFAHSIPSDASAFGAKEHELVIDYNGDGSRVEEIYFQRLPNRIKDERLSGGDFVILYTRSAEGETVVYRLEPSAYEYRVGITGNNPNLYNRFVTEMVTFTKANLEDPDNEIFSYPQYIVKDDQPMSLVRPEDRQIYWWSLFYDAVPPSYKEEVDGYFSRYDKDMGKVANFILTDYPRIIDPNNPALAAGEEKAKQVLEETKRINEDTRRRFDDLKKIATGAARTAHQAPYAVLRGLLINETGPSLYRMITTVQNIEKLRKRINERVIVAEALVPSEGAGGSVSTSNQ